MKNGTPDQRQLSISQPQRGVGLRRRVRGARPRSRGSRRTARARSAPGRPPASPGRPTTIASLSVLGSPLGRRLHRGGRHDLHQVVDDHVAQRADGVVEVAAVLDAEALGHRDLDRRDVVAVPDRLEHRVREPQVEDLGQPHLAQEVVDPVELGLVEVLVDLLVERARRGEVVPERLLDHHARRLGQARPGEPLDHHPEQRRRDLEVEDRGPRAARWRRPRARRCRRRRSRPARRRAARRSDRRPRRRSSRRSASIALRACSRRSSTVQSSTATPTIGQSSRPRASSR